MHSTRRKVFLIVLCLFCLRGEVFASNLPTCAIDYGNLMVSHWLTVSTQQQLERLLYYRGELGTNSPTAIRFQDQKKAAEATERSLEATYREYATLFKS